MADKRIISSEEQSYISDDKDDNFLRSCFPCRFVLALMGFLCFFVQSSMRACISVAIVAMVNWSELKWKYATAQEAVQKCEYPGESQRTRYEDGPFAWDTTTQGHILAAYFYGYAATQMLSIRFANFFRCKYIILLGTVLASGSTILIPTAAKNDPFPVIIVQIIRGLGNGITVPAFRVLTRNWIPQGEKVKVSAFVDVGKHVGSFVAVAASGLICSSPSMGWEYVFYIFGGAGLAFSVLWLFLVFENPKQHPFITRAELNKLTPLQSQTVIPSRYLVAAQSILTSKIIWAYIAIGIASIWNSCLYSSVLPLFLATVLKYDIEKNGLYSSIPFICETVIFVAVLCALGRAIRSEKFSSAVLFKIWSCIGLLGVSICMITVTFVGCGRMANGILLILAFAMNGFITACTTMIPLYMFKNLEGSICGLTNMFGALSGVVISSMHGFLTQKTQTLKDWSIIFYTTATISITAACIYLVCGSTKSKAWDDVEGMKITESGRRIPSSDITRSRAFAMDSSTFSPKRRATESRPRKSKNFDDEEDMKADQSRGRLPSSDVVTFAMDSSTFAPKSKATEYSASQPAKRDSFKSKSRIMGGPRPWRTDSFESIFLTEPPIQVKMPK